MHPATLLLFALAAAAHTTFTNLFVSGTDQGNGTCVRMPRDPQTATFPISSVTSADMACGADGEAGVARVCAAAAGATLSFQFREWPDASHPGVLDPSHKGPCAVYMKRVADATASGAAAGPGWFKVWDQAYDGASRRWCTEGVIANGGLLSVQVPADLLPGAYLVRPELLALHQADKTPPDPQFYVGCAQVFVAGAGAAVPADTVCIPGYVSMGADAAALTFDIYADPLALPYPLLGPPAYVASPANASAAAAAGPQPQQTSGLEPQGCVLVNANWCGIELAAYSDQPGCWAASAACWAQAKACYASAPPTGSANCRIWEAKCQAVADACNAGDFAGPPDAGKDLTPPVQSLAVPLPGNGGSAETQVAVTAAATSAATAAATSAATAAAVPSGGGGSVDGCGPRNASAACAPGLCCSEHNFCGTGADYCGAGCVAAFGSCD